jgi:hypothetical protein
MSNDPFGWMTKVEPLSIAEQRSLAFIEIDRLMSLHAMNKLGMETLVAHIDMIRQTAPGYDYDPKTGKHRYGSR